MRSTATSASKQGRLTLLNTFFIFAFAAICLQLFKIQVIDHAKYAMAAKQQQWGQHELPAVRGEIYSADNHLLAGTQNYFLMYGEPKKISDKVSVAKKLAEVFAINDYNDAHADAAESTSSQKTSVSLPSIDDLKNNYLSKYIDALSKDLEWIALEHRVSPQLHDELAKLNLEGIGFDIEPVRYYPENTLAAHLLGFVASDEKGENQGYFGIEGAFNEDLKGRKGRISEEVDAFGTPLLVGDSKVTPAIKGSTIYLTIDRSIQYIVEQKLKEGVEKYDAESGSVIVMDPYTGNIIAMANFPTYSPSNFNDDPPKTDDDSRKKVERTNLSISETYEPGSIMKPLTIATAIDLGIITPDTTFDDAGPVNYSGAWINNWDGKHYGLQTITQLLQKSNNIGAAWVGHKVGSEKIHEYFSDFGLGTPSHVELEGEDTGILRDTKTWTDIDLANISFGQGISATPLQMLNAINAIANGGLLMQPRIVQRVDDNGRILDTPTKVVRRVIKKQTSDTMVDLLEKAAAGGEAKYFILKNYKISGKTGTAQIPVDGKYDPDKTNASFVGFLTGSKKFSMIVKLEKPRASIFAAETAVPLWMNIAEELIKYYGIVPDKDATVAAK